MTDAELDALEAAAKAATSGPWETDSLNNVRNRDTTIVLTAVLPTHREPRPEDANYIAAANPVAVLDLIAELRQAKEECLHHKDYIAELEQSLQVYDKRIEDISKVLNIEHEDGSYAELSYIYNSVEQLQGELRQARASLHWSRLKSLDEAVEVGDND